MKTIQCIILALISIFFFSSCESKEAIKPNDETEQTDEDEQPTAEYLALIANLLECMNMERPADSYNYPVYPGMEEWENLKTSVAVEKACQVPKDRLKKMSTQAVLQALWEEPRLEDFLLWSSSHKYQRIFQSFFAYDNTSSELMQRTDAGTALLKRLLVLNPVHPKVPFRPQIFELLMYQPPLLSQLNEKELKQLIAITLKNDDLRGSNTGDHTNVTAWILMSKVLKNAGYVPFIEEMDKNEQLQAFIEDESYDYVYGRYGNIPQIIIEYAQNYIAGN